MNEDDFSVSGCYLDLLRGLATMSNSEKIQETHEPIPSFFVRWFILFRLYPQPLFQISFLFDVIIKRHPIYWNNVMKAERRRMLRKKEKMNLEI